MSSVESIILRLVATIDIIVTMMIPWLMALAAVVVSVCAALLVRRIVGRLNVF